MLTTSRYIPKENQLFYKENFALLIRNQYLVLLWEFLKNENCEVLLFENTISQHQ